MRRRRDDVRPFEEDPYGKLKRLDFVESSLASLQAGARVLDVGCGSGTYLTVPLSRGRFRVTGVDLHAESLIRAVTQSPTLTAVRAAELRCFQSGVFDCVICSEVLEHLQDPLAALHEVRRILRPGGILLVTVPNGWGFKERASLLDAALRRALPIDALRRRLRSLTSATSGAPDTLNQDTPHVQWFTTRSVRALFSAAGFRVVTERQKTLLCGPGADRLLRLSRHACHWNAVVADHLPMRLVSGWMFALTTVG